MGRRPGTHQKVFFIAKRLDGSGVVSVEASDWFCDKFKIADFPTPRDFANTTWGARITPKARSARGYNRWPGRISYSPDPGYQGIRPPTASFCMDSNSVLETWAVFAELLRVYYGENFWLRNKYGNGCRSTVYGGSNLAYLPGTSLHSVLSDFKLFPEPPPEHFLLRRRQIHQPALNSGTN